MQRVVPAILSILLLFSLLATSFSGLLALNMTTAKLSISGTTATCSVSIKPEKQTDKVEVSVQLVCGDTVVARWNGMSSEGRFSFSDSVTVQKGKTYTMKTTCSINGKAYTISDDTKKCK